MTLSSAVASNANTHLAHSHRREADVSGLAHQRCPCGAPVPQKRKGSFPIQRRTGRGQTTVTRVDLQEAMAITTAATLTGLALYLGVKVRIFTCILCLKRRFVDTCYEVPVVTPKRALSLL